MSSAPPPESKARFLQLVPALIGLVGVLIGAGATSGITYLGDHNRAKAEERGAERVVLAEIQSDDKVLAHTRRPRLSDAAWLAERERLARSLNNREWAWVAKYYSDLGEEERLPSPSAARHLELDEPCALVALNVSKYSRSPDVKALKEDSSCKHPPAAG